MTFHACSSRRLKPLWLVSSYAVARVSPGAGGVSRPILPDQVLGRAATAGFTPAADASTARRAIPSSENRWM